MLKLLKDVFFFDNKKLQALLDKKAEAEGRTLSFDAVDDAAGRFLHSHNSDCGPLTNVDGTPMCGDVDVKGNPFGVTNNDF